MKNTNEKIEKFLKTWKMCNENLRMFHYTIKTYPFDIYEKRLLKAFYFYKKNKKQETLNLLKATIQEEIFYEGVRLYLIGLTYNQHGHYIHAKSNLKDSIRILKQKDHNNFIINPLCLLINVLCNRREIEECENILSELDQYQVISETQYFQIEYARMCYYTVANKSKEAISLFSSLEREEKPGYLSYRPYFIVSLIIIQSQKNEFNECLRLLEVYKNFSGCVVKANYQYMKNLLENLKEDKAIYFYKDDFEGFPELLQQLEVVKALRIGDREHARTYWEKLSQHNPKLYETNFQYNGGSDLFGRAIQKYLTNTKDHFINPLELNELKTNLEKLDYIFSKTESPLKIEELIHLIWQKEYDVALVTRLRKLVSDYNKKNKCEIRAFQGTYKKVA